MNYIFITFVVQKVKSKKTTIKWTKTTTKTSPAHKP